MIVSNPAALARHRAENCTPWLATLGHRGVWQANDRIVCCSLTQTTTDRLREVGRRALRQVLPRFSESYGRTACAPDQQANSWGGKVGKKTTHYVLLEVTSVIFLLGHTETRTFPLLWKSRSANDAVCFCVESHGPEWSLGKRIRLMYVWLWSRQQAIIRGIVQAVT